MHGHYHKGSYMDTILAAESTLTDRYQTTVPETVRQALNLGKRDKIRYAILPDGSVRISRGGDTTGEDPVMMRFLEFLAADIESHPL